MGGPSRDVALWDRDGHTEMRGLKGPHQVHMSVCLLEVAGLENGGSAASRPARCPAASKRGRLAIADGCIRESQRALAKLVEELTAAAKSPLSRWRGALLRIA